MLTSLLAGKIQFWKNTGTAAKPVFTMDNTKLPTLAQNQNLKADLVDINSDGKLDLIVFLVATPTIDLGFGSRPYKELEPSVYLNTGTKTAPTWAAKTTMKDTAGTALKFYSPPASTIPKGSRTAFVTFHDFDNDGLIDMMCYPYVYFNRGAASDVTLVKLDISASFAEDLTLSIPNLGTDAELSSLALGDLDGDGDMDYVMASSSKVVHVTNYAVQAFCNFNGILAKDINRCTCFVGYSGLQCQNKCPGVAEGGTTNVCFGHGACRTSGASEGSCLCDTGFAGYILLLTLVLALTLYPRP
jgi:hypothetical protein